MLKSSMWVWGCGVVNMLLGNVIVAWVCFAAATALMVADVVKDKDHEEE